MDYKVAVVGGRDFKDYTFMKNNLNSIFRTIDGSLKIKEIISGGAIGADTLARQFAIENNITLTEFLPDWDKYGKRAGFLRNTDIVNACDVLVAFWDDSSKGTLDSITKAEQTGKIVLKIKY